MGRGQGHSDGLLFGGRYSSKEKDLGASVLFDIQTMLKQDKLSKALELLVATSTYKQENWKKAANLVLDDLLESKQDFFDQPFFKRKNFPDFFMDSLENDRFRDLRFEEGAFGFQMLARFLEQEAKTYSPEIVKLMTDKKGYGDKHSDIFSIILRSVSRGNSKIQTEFAFWMAEQYAEANPVYAPFSSSITVKQKRLFEAYGIDQANIGVIAGSDKMHLLEEGRPLCKAKGTLMDLKFPRGVWINGFHTKEIGIDSPKVLFRCNDCHKLGGGGEDAEYRPIRSVYFPKGKLHVLVKIQAAILKQIKADTSGLVSQAIRTEAERAADDALRHDMVERISKISQEDHQKGWQALWYPISKIENKPMDFSNHIPLTYNEIFAVVDDISFSFNTLAIGNSMKKLKYLEQNRQKV